MKGIFAFFCFLMLSLGAVGQVVKKVSIADTAYIYSELRHKTDSQLILNDLLKSTDRVHYRLNLLGQIVDVWHNEQGVFSTITNYAYEDESSNSRYNKLVFHKTHLGSVASRLLLSIMDSANSIPDARDIKGWGVDKNGKSYDVLHGVSYGFEYATPSSYTARWWSGSTLDTSLNEYKRAMALVDLVYAKFELQKIYDQFTETLKPGVAYSDGSARSFMIVDTHKRKFHVRKKGSK